jgi:hypothetical protein
MSADSSQQRLIERAYERFQRLTAPRQILAVLVVALLGLFAVGWLASVENFIVSWRRFDQNAGLMFLGAWAQLILAAVVWAQIRTAEATLGTTKDALEEARRQANAAEEQLTELRQQAHSEARRERADVLLSLAGDCANAAAHYQQSAGPLENLITEAVQSQSHVAITDDVRAESRRAEAFRQSAHSTRLRLQALALNEEALDAADDFVREVDAKRRKSVAVQQWLTTPLGSAARAGPPSLDVLRRPMNDLRDACVQAAGEWLANTP